MQETARGTLTLTARHIGQTMAVSREMLDSGDVTVVDEWMAGQVRVGITGFLWAQDVGETRVEWPANLWAYIRRGLGLSYKKAGKDIAFRAYYPEFRHNPSMGPVSLRVESDLEWDETLKDSPYVE